VTGAPTPRRSSRSTPAREQNDDTREAILTAIERVNTESDPRERIETHAIVFDAWLPRAELTETLKLRRPQIAERYATTIEDMYARGGG
jgi:long-subunit acyl-CoA synthetase (AMP-forming)